MQPAQLAMIAAIGVFAGTVNTIAGGGSLVTLPALIFLGLPATVANGTNRMGVLLQSVAATAQYRRSALVDLRLTLRLLLWTGIGATIGAWISVDIDERLFKRIIGVAMLLMLGVMVARPSRWMAGEPRVPRHRKWSSPLVFLAIGVYGGFLQAGVGIFLLAALLLVEGRDLLRANAVKVLLVAGFTVPPLVIYLAHDLVRWVPALALAAGSGFGGWLGARLTVSWGPGLIRWVLIAVVLISAAKLFGVF